MENNNNNTEKFKPTREWMEENYKKLNAELFNYELGDCILRPFTSGKGANGGTLGWFKITGSNIRYVESNMRLFYNGYYGREYIDEMNFYDLCQPCIELNANYSWTERAMLATLAHEMCHYYTFMKGYKPRQGHGPEFYSIGQIVSERSNGMFTIQRLASAEQMNEMELDADIKAKNDKRLANKKSKMNAVFVFNSVGSIEMSTTTVQRVVDEIVNSSTSASRWNKEERGEPIKIISSNDANLIEFLFSKGYKKSFKTYRYYNVENKPWINDINENNYNFTTLYSKNGIENNNTTVQPTIQEPKTKEIRMFRIKLNGGGVFETEGENYNNLKKALQNRFPNMKDEIIEKLINNPNNYYMKTLNENKISYIIQETINKYLLKEFNIKPNYGNDDDSLPIDPNMNLGLDDAYEDYSDF